MQNALPFENTVDNQTQFLELITANIHDIIGVTDGEGRILYRSNNCFEVFGYTPEELIGKSSFDYIHPEDRETIRRLLTELVLDVPGSRNTAHCRYIHKDGHPIQIEISAKNMIDHPLIQGVLITFHDETEMHALRSSLVKNNQRYKSLIDSMGHMVWSVNVVDFGLETFNAFMATYYKKTMNIDLHIGLTPDKMLPDFLIKYWMDLYHRVLAEGPLRVQYPMVTSDRVLTITLNPIYMDKTIVGISVFNQDETEYFNVLADLKAESAKYKTLIDNMHDYVFMIDAEQYTYQHYNAAQAEFVLRHYGVQLEIGLDARTFLPDDVAAFWDNVYDRVKREGQVEFTTKTYAGNRHVLFKAHLLMAEHQRPSILVFGEDLSAEMSYAQELEVSKQLLEAKNNELTREFEKAISAISKLGELRDPYTAGHQKKVQHLSVALAQKLNLSPSQINNLKLGALVHDIGKVYIPSEILNKPGKISAIEYKLIQSHAQYGAHIIEEIGCDPSIATMIFQHHERIDGTGYPQGLTGEHLLLESKILAVADVVEAISSHRPYRAALGIDEAMNEIQTFRGQRYDQEVVDACVHLFTAENYHFPNIEF